MDDDLLCDFTRTRSHCRDAATTISILVMAAVLNVVASLSALCVLAYRKRGFRLTIITGLFTKVGTGIQPKPLDCMLFFPMLAATTKCLDIKLRYHR